MKIYSGLIQILAGLMQKVMRDILEWECNI